MSAEQKIKELGIELPPIPSPGGNYVHAVRTGNLLYLSGKGPGPDAVGKVYNVGSDEEVTIGELALKVRDKIDPAIEILKIPYDQAYGPGFEDMRRRVPDLGRIHALIGYAPTKSLDQILDRVIEHMRQERS